MRGEKKDTRLESLASPRREIFLKMGDFFKRNSRRSNPSLMGFDEWLGRVLTHCTTWLAQKSITMGFLGDI
jgi:hypothetical protein